ncbi:fungal-specific transcription factor domain-containing protein [Xylariales sp. AK1849]|nr:fungal-specific transcription factor domain-containing protein [Xylariales sp. AK1849]
MEPPVVAKSQRKGISKSRTGCRTCKLKRLKCDETKPDCRNCLQRGRVCPGYQVSLQWSTKHEHRNPVMSPSIKGPLDFQQLASAASQAIVTEPKIVKHGGRRKSSTAHDGIPECSPQPEHPSVSDYGETANLADWIAHSKPSFFEESLGFSENSQPQNFDFDESPELDSMITIGNSLVDHAPSEPVEPTTDDKHNETAQSLCHSYPTPSEYSPVQQSQRLVLSAPCHSLIDVPTFLIEHWFKSVCCYWSACDSETNPYRYLGASLCGSSKSVFYSLQSMSAASLIEYLPHLRGVANSAPSLAIEAIGEELTALNNETDGLSRFPSGLVLSLFCMGSSLCWTDPQRLGTHFLRQVSRVLRHLKRRSGAFQAEDHQLLEFFNGCLKYEEMLRCIAGEEGVGATSVLQPEGHHEECVSVDPHAWTGVSPDILGLFGRAISLCRKECKRRQRHDSTTLRSMQEAMVDIEKAQSLEEILLGTETAVLRPSSHHGTESVRMSHLHDTTEAYRLSSLLQLYQTFPDLIARRIPSQIGPDGLVPYSVWLSPLALHIMSLLQRLPPTSDLRCIQPLLYLSVGSCLRYDDISSTFLETEDISSTKFDVFPFDVVEGYPTVKPTSTFPEHIFQSSDLTQHSLNIGRARKLVIERLSQLEQVLPPKPIAVAKQLMKAAWAVFDDEILISRKTHWLDIMATTGLRTLFG